MKGKRKRKRAAVRGKTVCVRGVDVDVFAAARAQAQAEGVLMSEWLERAIIRELARARQLQAEAAAS